MKIVNIGRSSNNDVNINDPLVSRTHCQIIQDDNGNFRLIDVNSKNGTFVNGERRHGEVYLKSSDIVRIGNSTLPWQTYFRHTVRHTGPVGGPQPPYPPQPPHPGEKPDNFLAWAILSTIFCCLPFGIVSIVYASKVNGLWYAGEYEEARIAASKARTWFWWAFILGMINHIILPVVMVVAEIAAV